MNRAVFDGLRAQLAQLRDDDAVRAVIITGAEGVFCAGADITAFEVLRAAPLLGDRAATGWDFFSELGSFPKPVIAAVEKVALGGGMELALACDIVIAGESAKFGVPEVKLGAIPGAGGTQRLIHAIGKSKAMALLLTGDFIDARKACDVGIVAEVTADGQALPTALAMASRIAAIRRWPWRSRKMRPWPALKLRSRRAWSMRSAISSSFCVRPTTWKGKRHSWTSVPQLHWPITPVCHLSRKTMKLNSDISAVITGASGLGAATARLLASHGVKVAIFDMNEAVGQALASELGGVYCNVDVTSEEQVDAAFARPAPRSGRSAFWSTAPARPTPSRLSAATRKPAKSAHARQIVSIASFRSTWWAASAASPSQLRAC